MATATRNGVAKNRIAALVDGKEEKKAGVREVQIAPPNMQTAVIKIRGTTPYVQSKFSEKAREEMKATQEAGSVGKKGKKRTPKDFKKCYEDATYKSAKGECGIPCGAFRAAMISACRTVGFMMTHAKTSGLHVEADCKDADPNDIGTELVKITGKRCYFESPVRNDNGKADIRARPRWEAGWTATLRIRFDADMLSISDVTNLLARVGMQIGIGEGRPDSKKSCGMGWGLFEIVN